MKVSSWLKSHQVLICIGSGGVGKTTISAALGVMSARLGYKTLVLTIDPARRLATSLGIDAARDQEVEITAVNERGTLSAYMIEPTKIFNDFVNKTAPNKKAAQRVLENRLFKELSTTLNGSQEFTSLEKLLTAIESQKYDRIILDTPPAQNALDFLAAPEKIYLLFQESITRWFTAESQQVHFLQKFLNRGTQLAMSGLERLTGSQFIGELREFFAAMTELQSEVSRRSLQVHQLLRRSDTGFILVTGFDEAKLKEAGEYLALIEGGGHHMCGAIVNRFAPLWMDKLEDVKGASSPQLTQLKAFHLTMTQFFADRKEGYSTFAQTIGQRYPLVRIPEMNESVAGIAALKNLADWLEKE